VNGLVRVNGNWFCVYTIHIHGKNKRTRCFRDLQRLDGHDYGPVAYFVGEAHQAEREGASVRSITDEIGGQCLTSDQYYRTSNTYENHDTSKTTTDR